MGGWGDGGMGGVNHGDTEEHGEAPRGGRGHLRPSYRGLLMTGTMQESQGTQTQQPSCTIETSFSSQSGRAMSQSASGSVWQKCGAQPATQSSQSGQEPVTQSSQ